MPPERRYALTESTAARLRELLADTPGGDGSPASGVGGSRDVLVRCMSETAGDATGVGAQCYPARILDPRCEQTATNVASIGFVWLSLIDGNGASIIPKAGRTYRGKLLGPVTFAGKTYPRVIAATADDFTGAAILSGSTNWQGRSWTAGSGWANNQLSGVNFESVEIDGITFLQKPTANALIWPSRAAGYYEGLPVQYANKVGGTYYPGFLSTGAIGTQVIGGDKDFDGTLRVHDNLTVNYAHTGGNLRVGNNGSDYTFGVYPGSVSGADVVACGPFYQSPGQFGPTVGDGTQFVAAAVNTMGLALWANSGAGAHGEATQSGLIYFTYSGGLGNLNFYTGAGTVPSASLNHLASNGGSFRVVATAFPAGFCILDGSAHQDGLWQTNALGDIFKGGILVQSGGVSAGLTGTFS
jgi:hypothetical protein